MHLALDTDEQAIADAAARFLAGEFPLSRLPGGCSDAGRLGDFVPPGWLGLSAPPAVGGSGLGPIGEMLFLLELGKVAGPLSVFTQLLAVHATRDEAKLCSRLVQAQALVALIVEDRPDGSHRLIGDLVGEGGAEYALAITPEAATLFALDGSAGRTVPCLDRSVSMSLVPASALAPIFRRAGHGVWQHAQLAVSAMLVGTAESALDMIVGYAKERRTFGRPIGAWQAVRHPCADMALRVEAARCQLYYAATALQEGQGDAAMHIDAAKLLAVRAAQANTDANIQLHGGIGVTEEYGAQWLLKRANLLWRLFGSSRLAQRSLLTLDTELQDQDSQGLDSQGLDSKGQVLPRHCPPAPVSRNHRGEGS